MLLTVLAFVVVRRFREPLERARVELLRARAAGLPRRELERRDPVRPVDDLGELVDDLEDAVRRVLVLLWGMTSPPVSLRAFPYPATRALIVRKLRA